MSEPFRSASTESSTPAEQPVASNDPHTQRDVDTDPAFTLYKSAKNKSFVAECLGLGEDFNQEAYSDEIKTIEDYFVEKAERGEIDNTTKVVQELIKKAEKELKLDDTERMVVKIQKLMAFFNFKKDVEKIVADNLKYNRE